MTDREKVIHGLECCLANDHKKCPYKSTDEGIDKVTSCTTYLMKDALAVVKAQKPHVMTLEELKEGESYWFIAGEDFIPRPVICVHREDDARKPYITFAWQYGTFSWESEDYGKTWRCWTARPTDEQREAAAWNN